MKSYAWVFEQLFGEGSERRDGDRVPFFVQQAVWIWLQGHGMGRWAAHPIAVTTTVGEGVLRRVTPWKIKKRVLNPLGSLVAPVVIPLRQDGISDLEGRIAQAAQDVEQSSKAHADFCRSLPPCPDDPWWDKPFLKNPSDMHQWTNKAMVMSYFGEVDESVGPTADRLHNEAEAASDKLRLLQRELEDNLSPGLERWFQNRTALGRKFNLTISLLKEYILFSLGFSCYGAGWSDECAIRASRPSSVLAGLEKWNDLGVVNRRSIPKFGATTIYSVRSHDLELFRDAQFQRMPGWLENLDFKTSPFLCTLAGSRNEFDAKFQALPLRELKSGRTPLSGVWLDRALQSGPRAL